MPIADLQLPDTGAIANTPIPEQTTVNPQQADIDSYQETAGPLRKGLRSGFNQVAGMANAFAATVGDSVGLTEFAKQRMKDAEEQVKFADAVGPRITDYRAVKDFADLSEYVQGLIGQNAASMLPAVAGAGVGRGLGGLRGAFAGAAAGSFVPNAGEQALRVRDTNATPNEKLGNVLGVGAATSALDMLAPGHVVGNVGKKAAAKSILKETGKTAALEGVTEGAQEAIGQAGHTLLDPKRDKSGDTADIINNAIAGAVGGGVLGGAGQTISKVAGLIPGKQQTKEDVETALGKEKPPIDEFDDTDILSNPDLNSEQDILSAIEEKGAKSVEGLTKLWSKVKDDEKFKKYADFATDDEAREGFIKEAKERFNELEIGPKVKRGFESIQAFVKGAKEQIEKQAGKKPKESKQRTAVDFAIYDNMLKHLDQGVAENLTPQQKIELSDFVKHVAMYEHGKRDENEGPGKPAFSTEEKGAVREQDRTTRRRTIPEGMLQYFGKNTVPVLNETNAILSKGGIAKEQDFTKAVADEENYQSRKATHFEDIVRRNLRAEIAADPEAREEAAKILAPRLLDNVVRGMEAKTVKKGNTYTYDAPQIEQARERQFQDQLTYAFGSNKVRVLAALDGLRKRMTVEQSDYFDEADPFTAEDQKAQDEYEQAEGTTSETPDQADEVPKGEGARDQGPFGDKRLGVPTGRLEEATKLQKQLTEEYDPRRVSFTVQQTKDGRYTVEAKDRIGEDSFSDQEWADIREPEAHGRSGLRNGIITVQLKDGRQNKINLVRLTSHAIATTPRQDTGEVNYLYDMVSRGLAKLLADPNVQGVNKFTEAQLIKGPQAWDLPDNTPVAYLRGRLWTWGEVKNRVKISSDELHIKRFTLNAVERAEEAPSIEVIDQVIVPKVDEKLSMLEKDFSEAKARAAKTNRGKDKAEAAKIGNWVSRVRSAKDRVFNEMDRRAREGDTPRHEIKGLVEDERKRGTTHAETPLGNRYVEGDTGVPVQGNVDRGSGGELDTGIPDRRKQPVKGSYQGKVLTDEQFLDEKDLNEELKDQRAERNVQSPSAVSDKGPLAPNLPLSEKETSRLRFDKQTGRPIAHATKSKPKPKQSTQNVGLNEPISDEEQKAVETEIKRILGPDVAVKFLKKMEAAGWFIKDPIETIAIHLRALDAMGVGRHEAAHALFARLVKADPKMAQTMLAAASSPTIITRLRSLLKDHPAALEQLSDPEERMAYMYQFWAGGLMKVGPNTKTMFDRVKGFFRRIAGIWSETFTHVENMGKAEEVFNLFQSGKLADENAVGQVLREAFPKTPFQKATELWPTVTKFFTKAFFTADARIRDTNIPAFIKIADQMFTPVGEQDKGPGMLQTRYMTANRMQNALHDIMESIPKAEHPSIMNALRGTGTSKYPVAVGKLQKLLDGIFKYMKDHDVKVVEWNPKANDGKGAYEEHDINHVKDYFPRYYDRQKIFENQDDFVKALTTAQPDKGYSNPMSLEEAQDVVKKVLRNTKVDPQENDFVAGLTYFAPNAQKRTLPVPDAVLAPYLHQDLLGTMYSYINYVTRRAEYASRFGNQGQEIEAAVEQARSQGATVDDIRTFNQAVMAMEGSLGFDIKPQFKQILGGIVTYQNYRLLSMALFTSLVDPMGIAVRGGGPAEAFNAFARGIRNIISENKDQAYHLAKTVGAISAATEAHMLADSYGTQFLTSWQRKANDFLFKWNGMESWNRSMRVAATAAAERFIIRHVTDPNEHSERYLRELGLTPDSVRIQNSSLVLTEPVKQAIVQWVDGAVLRPNAAMRPVWMSDPHWMVLAHLKQFTYSFQKTIVARVVHEIENGNYTPAYYMLSYVPLIIASDFLRAAVTPGGLDDEKMKKLGLGGLVTRGVQRAGLLGPGQYAVDAYGDLGHGKIPVTSFLGPTGQQLWDFGAASLGFGNMGLELKKAVPGYMLLR